MPSGGPVISGGNAGRRALDIVLSGIATIALSPLLFLIAVAIRLESRGPVFFRQLRVGLNEVPFRIVKFRTMVVDAERLGPKVSGTRDPRVTRVGGVLRATKMDELPQLWNVLTGEMTLVGPRAEVPDMIRYYTPEERETLKVKPGLTGPGQIYFTTDQAAELDDVEDVEAHYVSHQLHPKLALDLEYLRRRSLWSDLGVMVKTVGVLVRPLMGSSGGQRQA
jgi:lipopolysaccharide/colanic/teichoic acid biosynthesis glycosyltransferase